MVIDHQLLSSLANCLFFLVPIELTPTNTYFSWTHKSKISFLTFVVEGLMSLAKIN